ncbi:MAG: tol-pal system-associated acyl-CoA thioesterase [Thiotrichales bacterium]
MKSFRWPVRVYYEDTDAGGVVYYANYLRYFERARTEWLRALGFEQDALRAEGVLFAVRSVTIEYRLPARFNQLITVDSVVSALTRTSITFHQTLWREHTCLTDAVVRVVCLDAEHFKPRAIPISIREELTQWKST